MKQAMIIVWAIAIYKASLPRSIGDAKEGAGRNDDPKPMKQLII